MNYHTTPREEYTREAERVKAHHVLVENPALRAAINAALLHYERMQTDAKLPDMGSCACAFLKLQGAQEFVELLYNFCEEHQITFSRPTDNLTGNIKTPIRK